MHIFPVIGIMGMLGEYVVESMLGNGYEEGTGISVRPTHTSVNYVTNLCEASFALSFVNGALRCLC